MATYMLFRIEGNFLTITNDDTGDISNFPLSFTSYEIFIPQQVDNASPDGKTYLFLTNLDGSKRKTGGWDILSENCNYIFYNLDTEVEFTSLTDLRIYLNSILATPTSSKYKVYTALLTQSGGDIEDRISSGELVIGVTYQITDWDNAANFDFTNVGAPNNEFGTYFVATGTIPNSWGTGVVRLIFNTGAPVATVLENTIGNIWFTYADIGRYNIDSNVLFTDNKTFINGASLLSKPIFNRMILDDASGFGEQIGYFLLYSGNERIILRTISDAETFSDDVIGSPICIEIRVYN